MAEILLKQGKTKKVYMRDDGTIRLVFTDTVTVDDDGNIDPGGNNIGGQVQGMGRACLLMTSLFFPLFEQEGIATHFIEADLTKGSMVVRAAEPLGKGLTLDNSNGGVEAIGRLVLTGSFAQRYGLYVKDGARLDHIFTHCTLKDDQRGDPYIDGETMLLLGLIKDAAEYRQIMEGTAKAGAIVKREMLKRDLDLWDFKVEFGRHGDQLIMIDEIGPGSMRAFDLKTNKRVIGVELAQRFESV